MEIHNEDIKQKFAEKARDGKITCAECLAIGKGLKYPTKKIGPLLLEMDIKIVQCQLGCFP